jgi:DNA adenine methylase
MPETTSPLRYPGAKRALTDYIEDLLYANNLCGCSFFEPYAGSAAVGIELLKRNSISSLVLCEKDILLYAFWKCVFKETDDLCEKIIKTPVTIETWKKMLSYRNITAVTTLKKKDMLDFGFAGLFFNRTNFSGILNANPIGGINQKSKYDISCRFNKNKIIDIIREIAKYKNVVEINLGDAIEFMHSQYMKFISRICFAYFDPPYYEKGSKIYRHYYKNQDHVNLAKFIKGLRFIDWIISYDDVPFICNLYSNKKNKYQGFFLDYSCASKVRSKGQELLISNLPLPPFFQENVVGL